VAELSSGPGRVLVAVYAVFALAATGRSSYQLIAFADRAPLAYGLSALAALVYVVATVCLVRGGETARRVALVACGIEAVGVVVVGILSFADPVLFPDQTVWSHFGSGYGYFPLVLPFVALWWLTSRRRADREPGPGPVTPPRRPGPPRR
jgi:hypothetical protein